jgi:hypothetical protein
MASGWFHAPEPTPQRSLLVIGGERFPVQVAYVACPRSDVRRQDSYIGKVLLARLAGSSKPVPQFATLSMQWSAGNTVTLPLDLCKTDGCLRELLASLDSAAHGSILRFLNRTLATWADPTTSRHLAQTRRKLRDALRERADHAILSIEQPSLLVLDNIVGMSSRSFLVRGWARSRQAPLTRLTAWSPEGEACEILDSTTWYPRPDVSSFLGVSSAEALGFTAMVNLESDSWLAAGWVLQTRDAAGIAVEVGAPPAVTEPATVMNAVLSEFSRQIEFDSTSHILEDHLAPALTRLQAGATDEPVASRVVQYGPPPSAPEVTIVVPLEGSMNAVEHQLAQFALDPQITSADLVYVLDSPELAAQLGREAQGLQALFRIPFRVVYLSKRVGSSPASNVGAALARGRLLVLLSSDVLPDRPGWIQTMSHFYDTTPDVGALGAKLLYEDDSIQHAGIYWHRRATGCWEHLHYYRGLHRALVDANVTRPVPAVTAACMMIATDMFCEAGGLRGAYIHGGYEEVDLCLRLVESGRTNWYLADAELYHLEGQSYPSEIRELAAPYNAWVHNRTWDHQIEAVMRAYPDPRAVDALSPGRARQSDLDPAAVDAQMTLR